jgi:TRAP-type C4-dicarboxylate transport system substrate-binding protein
MPQGSLSATRPTRASESAHRVAQPRGRSVLSPAVFRLNAALLTAGLLAASAPAEAASFRLASLAPQDSAWGRLIQEMANEVDKATGGQVKFKLYLGGKLGDEAKVTKKLGKGLDGAFFTGQGMGLLLPAFRIQELPFLVENYGEADVVRRALWADFEADFEKSTDVVLVGGGETGTVYLFSKQPIDSVEGLKAAKLWVWEGDKVASDTFKVFGVSPRPLDILTVVQQLKSGGVDTVYNSPAGAVALGWTGDLGYVSGRNLAYASGGFVLTKKAWAEIPEAQRAVVKKVVTEYGEKIIAQARKDNEAALARLTGAGGGLKSVAITDAKYAEFAKVARDAWPDLAGNLGAAAYLDKARKALKK